MQAPVKTERTALLVVDMQNGFCHSEGSAAKIGFDINMCQAAIEPCRRLIAGAREQGVPVIFTRLIYRQDYRDGGVLTELGTLQSAKHTWLYMYSSLDLANTCIG